MQSRQRKVSQTTIAFVGIFFVIKIIFRKIYLKLELSCIHLTCLKDHLAEIRPEMQTE